VFGSLFGHTVTQNLPVLAAQSVNAPTQFGRAFNLAQGPRDPTFVEPGADGTFPWPDGVTPLALPRKQRPPEVDAWNVSVQRQLSSTMSVEVAYVGNYGRHVFSGDNPDDDFNEVALEGFITPGCTKTPCVAANLRRPFFAGGITPNVLGVGGNFGWTGRVQSYFNEAHNWYKAMQAKFTKRFADGWSAQVNYTLQKAENYDDDFWIYNPELNKGPAGFDRTHNFTAAAIYELPFGKDKKYGANWTGLTEGFLGGWQLNTNVFILSGVPFNVSYRNAGEDRDTGTGGLADRPDLIGDPSGAQTRDQWFNATAIGSSGSAFGRPAKGTFGNLGRNALRGPGFWQVDMSLFKNIWLGTARRLEVRIESVNVFNHVNLGNPDSQIGVPGNDNPNAGRITSTAGNYNARNFQFGFRFIF
jgi:hypothetical protein